MQTKHLQKKTHTKTNQNLITQKFKSCSHLCAYCCAPMSYTTQHQIVLIIFSLNLQNMIRDNMAFWNSMPKTVLNSDSVTVLLSAKDILLSQTFSGAIQIFSLLSSWDNYRA